MLVNNLFSRIFISYRSKTRDENGLLYFNFFINQYKLTIFFLVFSLPQTLIIIIR